MSLATHPLALAVVGFIVGFIGTLVGVGGGFFMVPYFLMVAGLSKLTSVGTSLAIIVLNAVSGSVRWGFQRRIDYRIGIAFALATIPATWLGREAAVRIHSNAFKIAFAAVVALAGMYLAKPVSPAADGRRFRWFRHGIRREFTDAFGIRHGYDVNMMFGVAASVAIGFLAALFGVGGGFLHVPMMIVLYGMPAHVAVATSQFVLAITASAAAVGYALLIPPAIDGTALLWCGGGAVLGAQAGAALAPRVAAVWLRLLLAAILGIVALGMLAGGLGWLPPAAAR
ncbi:MAG: sulfite exporter TauE/SafE family protein [Planctomycetes bacterium]|nr:sulfite exporter TauE/SafE family protein [Planctomycetota bacterium]